MQILVLRLLWRRQVSAKFFTLKDRIDNRPLLQRPLNCRPTLVSCKLGVGEGLFKRKWGWVYLYCSQAWEQGFYISRFPCPSDNVKNSAIFALCSGRHHDLNKFASGHFKNLEMSSFILKFFTLGNTLKAGCSFNNGPSASGLEGPLILGTPHPSGITLHIITLCMGFLFSKMPNLHKRGKKKLACHHVPSNYTRKIKSGLWVFHLPSPMDIACETTMCRVRTKDGVRPFLRTWAWSQAWDMNSQDHPHMGNFKKKKKNI